MSKGSITMSKSKLPKWWSPPGPNHDGELGETNPATLARRQKQIDYGKNSLDYKLYTDCFPKESRLPECPGTPDKYRKYSRRGFDGLIRHWKIEVHKWGNQIANPFGESEQ